MQGPVAPTLAPTLAPKSSDPAQLRTRLREAIVTRTEANAAREAAIAAQRRGEEVEKIARARYDEFADLDDRIVDLQSDEMAHWARHGDGNPPPLEFVLPKELADDRVSREAAREGLTVATDAVVKLRRDANAAQMAFTAAKDRVVYIAREIFTVWAKAVFQERAESQNNTWRLDDQCAALAHYWPDGAPLPVGDWRPLTRERYDADRRPGMPFQHEHYRALLEEWWARLLNDADAQFEWRPPRPEDHRMIIPRITSPNFVPTSLAADRRLEAEQAAAEAAAEAKGPAPFSPEPTVAEAFRKQRERLEAERLVAEAEADRRRAG
jgi:hypothetical protein